VVPEGVELKLIITVGVDHSLPRRRLRKKLDPVHVDLLPQHMEDEVVLDAEPNREEELVLVEEGQQQIPRMPKEEGPKAPPN
jgi:hypothetical protein